MTLQDTKKGVEKLIFQPRFAYLDFFSALIEYTPILPDLPEEQQSEALSLRQERLFIVLKQLDDSEKAIIALYLEELNYQQIAEITGINENYVGVKLNRIKNKIQKLLIK
ncbi:sigma factor-like helix-turn-helix DNA-binding protein [Mucilaginibacter sabulilitoris]|uniref:Sigma factor-like helix-turn-helix DNA-binding protein n=1 Tax=Mucilaginibacter sabulilitoris TaxID=1173583 RepID=A0ABZ0TVK8_9SPHI|nr:sigma factor-like helix-turn-helix DNA-binding protein [Mucilaginibacter sabulilitoris]WPU96173.1 sigma factor-like helix-turn-helix DNA-binding protein [Mucilaginibacter sabulilitoris]